MLYDSFPPGIAERLNRYVYRLVDPRNGETFYVGKGQGNRVFQHAKAVLRATADETAGNLKLGAINAIHAAGLEVQHVIHRHGLTSDAVAFEVEAAVLDCFSTANKIHGHDHDRGVQHVIELIVRGHTIRPPPSYPVA